MFLSIRSAIPFYQPSYRVYRAHSRFYHLIFPCSRSSLTSCAPRWARCASATSGLIASSCGNPSGWILPTLANPASSSRCASCTRPDHNTTSTPLRRPRRPERPNCACSRGFRRTPRCFSSSDASRRSRGSTVSSRLQPDCCRCCPNPLGDDC